MSQKLGDSDSPLMLTPAAEKRLREVCLRSPKTAGYLSNDEGIVEQHMNEFRALFDRQFNHTVYARDIRIERIVRVLNFCYKIDFELEKYFDDVFYDALSREEIITFFRNVFRLTMIELAERHNLYADLLEQKIPLIKGGHPLAVRAARDLSDKIIINTEKDSPEYVQAAIALLLHAASI